MTNDERIASLLGLAQKAGKIASGELAVEKAIKTRQAKLVIMATDCSPATKKGYRDATTHYNVEIHELYSKEQLGMYIGKMYRATLAVTDIGFCDAIKKLLDTKTI